uniref:Assembly factor CBP4 n=2 Tax=Chaetomium globosum (strain ATCC 6205 / CBS 148.51 / DSM 1962 / NBRC 6347 / NRRL 1970) TaxID=306901 RepID=CBP4_CHAGB|nr:RecName: Full=Assembly factor CBP4; AltName: Full=Cytochrome b mRNA-processing protein 4 [Chaetomium globosum CBS 148.51]
MVKKPFNWWLWTKMLVAGGAIIVGGPALTRWVQPTDEELFQKYNPELQKRSLERRFERQQEFDDFVNRLKRDSKSDKPIWTVQAEAEKERVRQASIAESLKAAEELKARKEAMRREVGLPAESASSETTR